MEDRIDFGYQFKDGLMTSDFYIPEYDMIIEMDGPCHFFQDRQSTIEGQNQEIDMSRIRDLTAYTRPKSRQKTNIKKSLCSKFVDFDFQAHNIMYLLGRLNTCKDDPTVVRHFVEKIENEL